MPLRRGPSSTQKKMDKMKLSCPGSVVMATLALQQRIKHSLHHPTRAQSPQISPTPTLIRTMDLCHGALPRSLPVNLRRTKVGLCRYPSQILISHTELKQTRWYRESLRCRNHEHSTWSYETYTAGTTSLHLQSVFLPPCEPTDP
jgi:hypothetical protein